MPSESATKAPTAISISLKRNLVLYFVVTVFAVSGWWLMLADREPMQKEMTHVYRKYAIALGGPLSSEEELTLRQRLLKVELLKQRCDKLAAESYRCEALVLINNRPSDVKHEAANAIYNRDGHGWRFQPGDVSSGMTTRN